MKSISEEDNAKVQTQEVQPKQTPKNYYKLGYELYYDNAGHLTCVITSHLDTQPKNIVEKNESSRSYRKEH